VEGRGGPRTGPGVVVVSVWCAWMKVGT